MTSISRQPFGVAPGGSPVELVTAANTSGVELTLISYGAAVARLITSDRAGRRANIALGFPSLAGYVEHRGHFFGATVGRFANRIGGGQFALEGAVVQLVRNDGENSLHGGSCGFDRHVWDIVATSACPEEARVLLRHVSVDGDMGYPGRLDAEVAYTLTESSSLRIDYRATTDMPTVINLTNHTLWNLAGEGEGTIEEHVLTLNARSYTPIDDAFVPTGEIAPVMGTPLDFTAPTPIGLRAGDDFEQLTLAGGYDHNFVLDRTDTISLELAARLEHPGSGRLLEVHTTEPGLQLYSGNFLDGSLAGPTGHPYDVRSGVALETQHFPDSPNHENFPSTVLRPGAVFASTTIYRFGVRADRIADS